jgi:hypothetical protein
LKKKSIAMLASILILILLLPSCGAKDGIEETSAPEDPAVTESAETIESGGGESIAEYFFVKSNTCYQYESSIPDLNQQVYVTYTGNDRIQRWVSAQKMSSTEVIEYKNGELKLIFGEPTFYYMENLLSVEPTLGFIILKEPLQVGQKWAPDEYTQVEITSMNSPVSTSSGDYEAMEISSTSTDGRVQREYYAKNVGLVKTEYTSSEGSLYDFSLKSIESATLDFPAYFYPIGDGEKEERFIRFTTDSDLAELISDEMHIPLEGGLSLLPEGVRINSLDVDRTVGGIAADLSSTLESFGTLEEQAVQAIADTLGNFYDISKVKLTVSGASYKPSGDGFIEVRLESAAPAESGL